MVCDRPCRRVCQRSAGELRQALAAAAARRADVGVLRDHRDRRDARLAGGDHRADGRGLGALALRIGGVLDVGAGVDPAAGAAQRGADREVRVRAVRVRHRRRARRRAAPRGCRAGVRVAAGDEVRRRRSRAPRWRSTSTRSRRRPCVRALDAPRAPCRSPRPSTRRDGCARSPRAAAAAASPRPRASRGGVERLAQRSPVRHRDAQVLADARLLVVGAAVGDQLVLAGRLLAQLHRARSRRSTCRAGAISPSSLAPSARASSSVRAGSGSLDLSSTLRIGSAPTLSSSLARPWPSVSSSSTTPCLPTGSRSCATATTAHRRVPPGAVRGFGDPRRRGRARAAGDRGRRSRRRSRRRRGHPPAAEIAVVPVLRAGPRDGRGLPAAAAGRARRPPRHAARRGGADAARLLRAPAGAARRRLRYLLDPMLATGGSAVHALDRLREAGARRLALICLVAAPEGLAAVEAAHPDVTIWTRRSTASSTSAATSAPAWATRATASSARSSPELGPSCAGRVAGAWFGHRGRASRQPARRRDLGCFCLALRELGSPSRARRLTLFPNDRSSSARPRKAIRAGPAPPESECSGGGLGKARRANALNSPRARKASSAAADSRHGIDRLARSWAQLAGRAVVGDLRGAVAGHGRDPEGPAGDAAADPHARRTWS